MLTREDAINQSIIFVDLCKKSGLEIQKAFIFGSYAKNIFSEFSDIDLALVSNQFTTNSITNNKMTSIINIRFPEIEVHHFNAAYFEKGDSFISEITSNGIEIKN